MEQWTRKNLKAGDQNSWVAKGNKPRRLFQALPQSIPLNWRKILVGQRCIRCSSTSVAAQVQNIAWFLHVPQTKLTEKIKIGI